MSYKKPTSFRRMNGQDAITFSVIREPGSNVVAIVKDLKKEIEKLNNGILADNGLVLKNVYDETVYINSAIALVKQNIVIGGAAGICVLMLFLRSFRPTFIIMLAIPVSVIGTFVAIAGLGLSVNVISLAGLAFAVGMVVDASIVSQENIIVPSDPAAIEAAYKNLEANNPGATIQTDTVFDSNFVIRSTYRTIVQRYWDSNFSFCINFCIVYHINSNCCSKETKKDQKMNLKHRLFHH